MKTVLITGASEGIGFAFAKKYARDGYRIILAARNLNKLEKAAQVLKKEYQAETVCIQKDLSENHAAEELYSSCKEYSVDVLINNAGCGYTGTSWKQDIRKEEEMIRLNVTAVMSLSKLFLKEMTERKDGIIINVSSTGAFQPGPYIAGYYASKSFVLSYTKALSAEAKPYGVKVYCLCPGPVKTAFYEKGKGQCPSYAMSPDDVVEYMCDHIGKNRCVVIPGAMNRIAKFLPADLKMKFVSLKKKREINH